MCVGGGGCVCVRERGVGGGKKGDREREGGCKKCMGASPHPFPSSIHQAAYLTTTTDPFQPFPSPSHHPTHSLLSQGVGYGMLLALYSNDQAYFNTQLDNAEKYMWNGRYGRQ